MGIVKKALVQWDRVGGLVVGLAGLGVLIAGCVGVSAAAGTRDQLSYLVSGGVLGLFLLAVGCTLWLSADLRDAWRKVDRLQTSVDTLTATLVGRPAVEINLAASGAPGRDLTGGDLVAGEDMTLFHRPDCQLVTGKPVEFAGRASHERHGRHACGICTP
jgi:hypothetical protein